jgi:arylsulfatase A-like enzyme
MAFPSARFLPVVLCLALAVSCSRKPAPHAAERERGRGGEAQGQPQAQLQTTPQAQPAEPLAPAPYRLDEAFPRAAVDAPSATSRVRMAESIRWTWKDSKVTWEIVRGRMGFKEGMLIVKGEGATPVIISPSDPLIDWSRYRALRIRMIAEGGAEIKIKLGDVELKNRLAAPMQWGEYSFDLKGTAAGFTKPMAIMPTDDLNAPVGIEYIELVPRESELATPAGVTSVGKREEYRRVVFARAPSSITYIAPVPSGGRLRLGLGVSSAAPVTFRVLAGSPEKEVFTASLSDPEVWKDVDVDLSGFAGPSQQIVLRTESRAKEAVGFWAAPRIVPGGQSTRPNVLLYVICTLRPDHTSLYGYGRDTTPFLKRLGAEGVVFEDAHSQAPWTKPSVASMLTSLNAYTHGLVRDEDTIPKGAATLAEQLRSAGYLTASIVANPFAGRASGLDRGFDYMMEYPVVQRHRTDAVDRGTDSAAINRALAPWIEHHAGEPFFLFVQSTDPHAPYRPPADYERRFGDPGDTSAFNRMYGKLRDIRAYGGGATVTRAEMTANDIDPESYIRQAVMRYDAEIAHNDKSIELLLGKLRDRGALDRTLVVIASDHGEEFWEHGFGAHGHSLYNELIRTALLFWNPALLPNARRVREPVSLTDLMPTLLEMVSAAAAATQQGQSLVPLLKGRGFTRQNALMATKLALPRAKPGGGVPENLTDTFARMDGLWKLIYRAHAERAGLKEIELYDRRADPAELHDVAAAHPDVAGKFKGEIGRWMETQQAVRKRLGPGGTSRLDPQTIERLRSLGYLGGKQ